MKIKMNYLDYAQILWDYHRLNNEISRCDCIVAFGSHDLRVAERTAELYKLSYSNIVIFTGGVGKITKNLWNKTEADFFRDIAIKMGVPYESILVENQSTNTGENIVNVKELLKKEKINYKKILVVDKPYRERRTYATLKKQWSEIEIVMTSPQFSFMEYYNFYKTGDVTTHEFISIMVGDLQRIDIYAKNGFQIEQYIPNAVWNAYHRLIELGFTKHMIKV